MKQPKPNLFCIPYAGGVAKLIYNGWREFLGHQVNIIPMDLAGHGSRMKDPFYYNIKEAVSDLFTIAENYLNGDPYAVYAHSMGTIMAYELVLKIEKQGLNPPSAVFLSGRYTPDYRYQKDNIYLMNDEDFLAEVYKIGGISREMLDYPELIKYFLPILRNDYAITQEYTMSEFRKLNTDIIFLYSDQDSYLPDIEAARQWQRFSAGQFKLYEFQGGHFFINEQKKEVCRVIHENICSVNVLAACNQTTG